MGAHQTLKGAFFARKPVNINVSRSVDPETSSCASKPILLQIRQTSMYVLNLIRTERDSDGPMSLNLTRGFFVLKTQ